MFITGHWLLRTYCMYVLFLAVNGVTEGFAFAMMSKQHIDRSVQAYVYVVIFERCKFHKILILNQRKIKCLLQNINPSKIIMVIHRPHYLLLYCSHNYLLIVSTILYLVASYVLTGVCGSAGLILANCVNMAVRIVCSLKFIKDFFSTTSYDPLRCSIPSVKLLLTFIIVSIITVTSEVMSFVKFFTYLCK